ACLVARWGLVASRHGVGAVRSVGCGVWHGPVQAGQRESPADARRRKAAYARLQKISWTIDRKSGLSTHDIEDIHQEALERTTKYIYRGGNRPANHEAFFTTVVKNLCVD